MIHNVKFSIDIESGNAGLVENPEVTICDILREIASKLVNGIITPDIVSVRINDINGNEIGSCNYRTEDDTVCETADDLILDIEGVQS